MFGARFFGKKYFSGDYFPPPSAAVTEPEAQATGGGGGRSRSGVRADTDYMMIEVAIMLIVSGAFE